MKKSIALMLVLSILSITLPRCTEAPSTLPAGQHAKNQLEELLTQWIYSNSEKISRATAGEIARTAMQEKYKLLILAIACSESAFLPTALSPKGARGLMQVMPGIHGANLIKSGIIKESRDLYNIRENIRAGSMILKQCLDDSKGNVAQGLSRYVSGHDGFENSYYVKKIQENLTALYVVTAGMV